MMRNVIVILAVLLMCSLYGQNNELQPVEKDSVAQKPDPLYREDQFYASISYNLMQGKPPGYSQSSFSSGFTVGFLRDMPVNKSRTIAVAAGLGYSYNNIKHNLIVTEIGDERVYSTVDESTFDKNKLVLHFVELPIELRWRNSNSVSHKFWRVYTGFKISYLFNDRAQLQPGGGAKEILRRNPDMNKLVYGAYLAAGWNTWNMYVYYGITPLYKSAILDNGDKIKLNSLNLGLMFYIL